MSGIHNPEQDSISEMLRDSGLDGSLELRDALEQLRALVPERAPAPRPELAALLAAGAHGFAPDGPAAATAAMPAVGSASAPADATLPPGVASLAERRRKRRLAVVGGAVMGAMSLGTGAVAASSEDFRLTVGRAVGVMFQPADQAPARDHAGPSPAGIPAVPAASGAAPSATAPAPPTTARAVTPGMEKPVPPAAGPASPDSVPPAAGRGAEPAVPGGSPLAPGLPVVPGLGGVAAKDGALGPLVSPAPARSALPGG